ncbi:MAG: hypothetical protein JNL88_04075 [Bacteroidia bacterium]|nr:hypothetical protein [Bacteroidia bacterium]
MKKITCLLLVVFLAACSAKMNPTQKDVDRVSSRYEGYTLEMLLEGKQLYEANCTLCHKLKSPKDYSEEKLNKVVPAMVKKLHKKKGSEVLDAAAQESILRYLVTMSTR